MTNRAHLLGRKILSAALFSHVILVVFAILILTPQFASPQQPPQALDGKTAGQVFKNVKVLADTPADQFNQSMHLIKAAVGMDCEECHVDGDFPADTKMPKAIARQMMQMVIDLNKNSFKGQSEVTCYTCHRAVARIRLICQGCQSQSQRKNPMPFLPWIRSSPDTSKRSEAIRQFET
jgi:hypothetical protein